MNAGNSFHYPPSSAVWTDSTSAKNARFAAPHSLELGTLAQVENLDRSQGSLGCPKTPVHGWGSLLHILLHWRSEVLATILKIVFSFYEKHQKKFQNFKMEKMFFNRQKHRNIPSKPHIAQKRKCLFHYFMYFSIICFNFNPGSVVILFYIYNNLEKNDPLKNVVDFFYFVLNQFSKLSLSTTE